jgi:hypothetical protein
MFLEVRTMWHYLWGAGRKLRKKLWSYRKTDQRQIRGVFVINSSPGSARRIFLKYFIETSPRPALSLGTLSLS